VVFAEGEEEQVIRAAASFVEQGLGTALLVGREDRVRETARTAGIELGEGIRSSMRGCRAAMPNMQPISMSGCSARAT
jgi:phosphotransacetylase